LQTKESAGIKAHNKNISPKQQQQVFVGINSNKHLTVNTIKKTCRLDRAARSKMLWRWWHYGGAKQVAADVSANINNACNACSRL
jgi:hypothetical protein